ncbi:MAG: sugar ABC transporter permease [Candidatus Coproplasma sp.]
MSEINQVETPEVVQNENSEVVQNENSEVVQNESSEVVQNESSEVVQNESSEVNTKRAKRHMGIKASRAISNTIIYIILVIMSVVWLIPFVCIVLQSFRVESTHMVGYIFPQQWGFDNYIKLADTDFFRWYLNTFIIAIFSAVLQTVIVLCMSYTLSRFRFKGRKGLMRFMLIIGMFPGMLTMIILYRILSDMGLTQDNAVPGLILVYVASSGMGYYISKGFFDTIPKSLDEAARIDGATRLQILFKVILPLAKPIVIYTVLTAFMAPWADFVFARYVSMNTSAGMNVAVGLYSWLNKDQIHGKYTMFCAGGVLVAIPVTLLFMLLQKYYVSGVTGGAVKG